MLSRVATQAPAATPHLGLQSWSLLSHLPWPGFLCYCLSVSPVMLQSSEVHTLGGLFVVFPVCYGGVVLLFVVVRDQTQDFARGMHVIACLCAFI